jgi:hypothetical protein
MQDQEREYGNVRTHEAVFVCTVLARVLLGAHISKLLDASDADRWHTVFRIRAR